MDTTDNAVIAHDLMEDLLGPAFADAFINDNYKR